MVSALRTLPGPGTSVAHNWGEGTSFASRGFNVMPYRSLRVTVCALLLLGACSSDETAPSASSSLPLPPGANPVKAPTPNAGLNPSGTASADVARSSSAQAPSTPIIASGAAGAAAGGGGSSASRPQDAGVNTSGEHYDHVGTNPFVLVAHDPFSTFAADVDTASYDIFRRNAEHNLLPDQDSVRVEEFVNYFEYVYPAPAADATAPFEIALAAAANPFGRETKLLRVGIQAKRPAAADKKPANVVFLVDVSGSMQTEDKLPLVQYLLTQTLSVLDADDKVSVVTYASGTSVRLPPTSVVQSQAIADVVNGLSTAGGTNGAGGIQLAYQQAESAFIEGGINHVVLCTDGDFNIGVSNVDELVKLIESKRKTGVTLTALGFGIGNLNDSLMERVSNAGNGIYSVITSRTQAARYAEQHILSTLIHVAKDMKIQLEWNPAHVLAYRLIGYEDRAIADQDFRNDVVDAGEVGAGHRVTALFEVAMKGQQVPGVAGAPLAVGGDAVPGDREAGADDLVVVKVRYKQPNATESDPAAEVVRRLAPDALDGSFDAADQDMRWTVAIAAFAEILKHSPYATPTRLGELREIFVAQQDRDLERKEFLQLFERATSLLPPAL
jgi:Ca-activated chloride channel family protein